MAGVTVTDESGPESGIRVLLAQDQLCLAERFGVGVALSGHLVQSLHEVAGLFVGYSTGS
jgi:hypothetical protein